VPFTDNSDEEYDITVRPGERQGAVWRAEAEVIDKQTNRSIGTLDGEGRTRTSAEDRAARAARQWLREWRKAERAR
jgi:hypothetical protein